MNKKANILLEPGRQEIIITREFDAPRDTVFRVFHDPEAIPHWWGPSRLTTTVEAMDVRPGGSWRFVQKDTNGNIYAFRGVYHDIIAPSLSIGTFEFEGLPEKGHVALDTARFDELPDGRTKLTTISVFQTVSDRDGMAQSGMEEGVQEGYWRFDSLLEKIRNTGSINMK